MSQKNFVAVNYIDCKTEYRERFEELFGTRAKQIDTMPGFIDMQVLRPSKRRRCVSYYKSLGRRAIFQRVDQICDFFRWP